MVAPVGSVEPIGQRVPVGEDGVLERRSGLRRGDLEPARRGPGVVAQRMRDAALDEHVVVRPELLGRAGRFEDELAREHVERLLERVQVRLDAPSRLELRDHDLLVDGAAGAVDDRPAHVAAAVSRVAARASARLAQCPTKVHLGLLLPAWQ
jgi:hypothetical protein